MVYMDHMSKSAVQKALEKAIEAAGSQTALAALIGVTQPTISAALKKGRCSTLLARAILQVTGIQIGERSTK